MTDDESEDEDFFVDLENIVDDVDVDMKEFHIHVDEDVEWVQKTTKEASGSGVDFTEGEDLEVIDPESFESPIVDEDNNRERMLRDIRKEKSCSEGVVHQKAFTLGQKFKTKKDVKEYINKHAVETKRDLHFEKNDKTRIRAKCRGVASDMSANIVKQIESNPTIPVNALQEDLIQKFEMNMLRMKKQHVILKDYGLELMERNPSTNVKIDCYSEPNLNSDTRTFRRIYICLGALKEGFKANLRDFIGLDGTFMKGPYPGQILTAVGVDSNNGIYPLAYALVENKTTNSWTWFLEQLGDDLELYANSNFTFISDRHKGIIPAIVKLFPQAEHRFCLRHIYENMKRQWKDKELKDLVWACATATTVRHFEKALEELKKFKVEAHDWLIQIPPAHWARSHFSGRAHTNILLNNVCEVLNGKIQGGRDKPFIYYLEYIREYLMKRICNVQREIDRCHGPLTPTATSLLDQMKRQAQKHRCIFNGVKNQVITHWGDQFIVNLDEKTCTCRHWEITGMLCSHSISAIWDKIKHGAKNVPELEHWVHPCYWLVTWAEVYKHKIEPINGRLMWPKSQCLTKLLPPKHVVQVGRPKKKRKRVYDEPSTQGHKLSKRWTTVTCRKCNNKGHNSRTCKGQGGPNDKRTEETGG
ncbi:uncharacterized protein LOC111905781 [Lactuca sativa]|uniref:uncharacterized protein LOC111905781 n=1 Tax=Lactuca sativa TaxID=4236 RepID=UPI000CD8ECF4|nr:uncharacterized protein LOC111905781 [Lactuca sativa]